MKKILIILLGLVILGGIGGYFLWNKPHQNVAAAKADVSFTSSHLLQAFETDENAANVKYLDKVIKVNGVIKDVENNESGEISVILATDNEMSSVICNFDPAFKDTKQLEIGKKIIIKGLCSGYLMDVVLDRCVIAQ